MPGLSREAAFARFIDLLLPDGRLRVPIAIALRGRTERKSAAQDDAKSQKSDRNRMRHGHRRNISHSP